MVFIINMFCYFWINLLFFGGCLVHGRIVGAMQVFRLMPKDLKVHEGGEAKLECEISNLQGQVQWTKDGYALGFSPEIPGYPRYSYVGDRSNGVYNLLIKNVSLEDDGEFQCQVGPHNFHKAIRANATLTVVSPPSVVEIVAPGLSDNKIQINENQPVEIECRVKNAKPPATVYWFRGGVQLKSDRSTERLFEVKDKKVTRYTVSSKLKLKPTADDDFAEYFCEARHEALPLDFPMRAKVELSVQYPPGQPYIEGYVEGETVRKGQTVELVCRSRGGNPPAQLIWYKNGEQIRMAYRTSARLSENIYTFTAEPSDNKAKYKCEASNILSTTPLKAEVTLNVYFAPAHATISGVTEARVNDRVILTCTTDASNPAAEIKWLVNGRQMRNTTSDTIPAASGGFITISNITVPVGQNRRSIVAICHGLNMHLTENVVSTHTVNVLYPPGAPIISGIHEDTPIVAGSVQRISCISSGGNPLATLTWYKNDKKIHSVSKETDRFVSAELNIVANASDNGAVYKCEASNPATEIPLIETFKMKVFFPPEHVQITEEPKEVKPGDTVVLTCEASSSYPPAKLSWWREGIPISGASNETKTKVGLHGGTVSSIRLQLNVTPELAGTVFTCQATNEILQKSVHQVFTLDVLYKPMFDDVPDEVQTGVEGESMVVSLFARGNPTNIAYTWSRSGMPLTKKSLRILADGPVLNFTRLSRNDTGMYTCEASNSEGRSMVHVNISVKYPVEVVDAPSYMTVDAGEEATLYCRLVGEPLNEDHIKWRSKAISDLNSRSSVLLQNGTSVLRLRQVALDDAGPVECVAGNGIGNETSRAIPLLVKFKPEMDMSPAKLKAASNTGGTGKLVCRIKSVPKPAVKWLRDGQLVSLNTSKFTMEFHEIDLSTFESILLVNDVTNSDYGKYECEARNEKGLTTATIVLDVTSPPDAPIMLAVENATHDSILLKWTPGFDGGLLTSFRIRYRPKESNSLSPEGFRYVEVENVTLHVVTGLELDTEYVFSIMAFNKLGSSNYFAQSVSGRTTDVPPTSLQSPSLGTPEKSRISSVMIAVVAASGVALLALNVLLVGCCLRRRRTKRFPALLLPEELMGKVDIPRLVIISVSITGALLLSFNILLVLCFVAKKRNRRAAKAGPGEQGSNKSATIEMYAPSSYNETVTGETLSSVSEKSENYSNAENNEDYPDEGRKAASTYLIDQIDYPFPSYAPAYEMQPNHQNQNQQQQQREHGGGINHMGNHVVEPSSGMPLPMPLKNTNYVGHVNALLAPPTTIDSSYYSLQPDSRYVAYPPPLEFSQGSLRRVRGGIPPVLPVPPPDVTVLHNPPVLSATLVPHLGAGHLPPVGALSSFTNPASASLENEGHLV